MSTTNPDAKTVHVDTPPSEWQSETESYVRINIEKNTKAYNVETTVSLRWVGNARDPQRESDLSYLLSMADDLARDEIDQRQLRDKENAS